MHILAYVKSNSGLIKLRYINRKHDQWLPAGPNVGRDLEITHCPRLQRLPDGLRVGGRIITDFGVFTSVASAQQAFKAKFAVKGRPF